MSQVTRLWIDDDDWSGTRNPPSSDWTWAKTSQQALDVLTSGVNVIEVSFDHDLGLVADCKDCGAVAHEGNKCCNYCCHDDTSRCVVTWMIENDAFPAVVRVHTQNNIAYEWLVGTINRYGPGVTQ